MVLTDRLVATRDWQVLIPASGGLRNTSYQLLLTINGLRITK